MRIVAVVTHASHEGSDATVFCASWHCIATNPAAAFTTAQRAAPYQAAKALSTRESIAEVAFANRLHTIDAKRVSVVGNSYSH